MTTQEDLNWWLTTAAEVSWTWAKTYADTAPHDYVVEGRTPGLDHNDYVRAAKVIHTFGRPGKYFGLTKIYLTDQSTGVRWWTEDLRLRDTTLINRATTARNYGVQNAPDTSSGITTPYDPLATTFDDDFPTSNALAQELAHRVRESTGNYPPCLLDIGCGTGRVLDLKLVHPTRYAGVDPSSAMLNMLVRKHPAVARVYPTTIERALADARFTPRQFDIVTLIAGPDDHFSEETVATVAGLASRAFIRAVGEIVEVHKA